MPYLQDRQGAPGPGQQAAPAGRGGRYGLGARGWLGGAVRPGGADVVKVRGRVDWRARLTMEEVMRHTAERAVIVDLSATEPDFHGRKEVVVFLARARQRGRRAIVVSPDPALYMSLLGHGLRPIIPVVSSEPEAVRWLVRHPWRG